MNIKISINNYKQIIRYLLSNNYTYVDRISVYSKFDEIEPKIKTNILNGYSLLKLFNNANNGRFFAFFSSDINQYVITGDKMLRKLKLKLL